MSEETQDFSREVVEQYEKVRQSGLTNMFDYYNVVRVADDFEYYDLAGLTRQEYGQLLQNFSRLMSLYGISQT